MASCHRTKVVAEGEKEVAVDSTETSINENDSFIVVYRQPVNGYKVKAVVRLSYYDNNCADITFVKNGKSFTLSTISYGDSLFNKGGWGMDDTNEDIIKK